MNDYKKVALGAIVGSVMTVMLVILDVDLTFQSIPYQPNDTEELKELRKELHYLYLDVHEVAGQLERVVTEKERTASRWLKARKSKDFQSADWLEFYFERLDILHDDALDALAYGEERIVLMEYDIKELENAQQ